MEIKVDVRTNENHWKKARDEERTAKNLGDACLLSGKPRLYCVDDCFRYERNDEYRAHDAHCHKKQRERVNHDVARIDGGGK